MSVEVVQSEQTLQRFVMSHQYANIRCFAESYPKESKPLSNAPPLTDAVSPAWIACLTRPIKASETEDTANVSASFVNPYSVAKAMPGSASAATNNEIFNVESFDYDPVMLEQLLQNHDAVSPIINVIAEWQYFKRFYNSEPCAHHANQNPCTILEEVFDAAAPI